MRFKHVTVADRNAMLAALERAAAEQRRFALLLVNLEKFRDINIELGHRCGDELLQRLAERIDSVLRADDAVFHIGADEFAVILGNLGSPQLAELAARKMLEVIGANVELDGRVVAPVARVGGAVFPDHAGNPAELMQIAEAAQQKARGHREGYIIYDQLLRVEEQTRSDLKGKLKVALDNSDLMLYYQPQVNLQEGVISGCEALVRWNEADHGWISPEVFIPVAESGELIDTLTYWSVNVALREWFRHCRGCSQTASISVNLSAKLLHSPEVVELIQRAGITEHMEGNRSGELPTVTRTERPLGMREPRFGR